MTLVTVRYARALVSQRGVCCEEVHFAAALQCICRPSDEGISRDTNIRPYHGVYEVEGVHYAGAGPELAALCGTGGVESIFRDPSIN